MSPADPAGGAAPPAAAPPFDVDALLADRATRIIVCCGSGGVGKTTTAAALGVRAAEHGRGAVVITVDPARRLAQSMGLTELDNTPRPVPLPAVDGAAPPGTLHAMMLDMKRTFDEIVEAHADPERARQILANPFYQSLSSSFSGTQEYMAMEKLGQLRQSGDWDLIIVDTPPSRSALDFLDAPKRLGRFLDSRLIRILGAPPATGAFKLLGAGVGMVTGIIAKVVGAQVLSDVQRFVGAFDAVFGGFQERAERTYRLLQARGTGFVVVAAPEGDALREAAYFIERLRRDRMPLAGVVLNRVHRTGVPGLAEDTARAAAAELAASGEHPLAGAALRLHAERMRVAARERHLMDRLAAAHPQVPAVEVPARPEDVHDLAGLAEIGRALAGRPAG
ncbi:ArsA family ATPase [Streptomonospora nanhaiensis]|uniref:Anion-transporting ArsA/GET3 family ATPase n=1 Tax=Streptomonospora nanhaiensis TaxID=1323731 RepID=A0A853BQY9_9ACTN|nr:ArsA family ATPase [Streptomonospora nanhaiensis]MBV2363439.1 ArsA family ATPase [Streptomonospora nanhaiensis]MBX9387673.1 ArsA family ATPase [Streptomonospora nanhaiensis]NYI96901.1 anion-transporting ArsA/GET3 family ATPase [Streptomonospora nanhaiensis]